MKMMGQKGQGMSHSMTRIPQSDCKECINFHEGLCYATLHPTKMDTEIITHCFGYKKGKFVWNYRVEK
jgi:hypothetical protein